MQLTRYILQQLFFWQYFWLQLVFHISITKVVQALFCSWIHLLSFKLKILTLSSLKFIRAKIYAPFWSQLSVHAEKIWGSSRFSLSDLLKWPTKTRVYNSVQTELHLRFSKNLRKKCIQNSNYATVLHEWQRAKNNVFHFILKF